MQEMLRKGAIRRRESVHREFFSNLFLTPFFSKQKGLGSHTGDNSKKSEHSHSISAFQNGRNAFNNGTSTKKDYLIKIDLKDAYLSMPLGKYSRKYTLFQ